MSPPSRPLLYAVIAVPLAFLGLPLYVYLPARYAELPAVGLALAGGVLLAARLLDLLTDPLVGLVADRWRDRVRPVWIIAAGASLMGAGAWWLFQPPATAGALYLFACVSATYLGWTLMAVPYYALGAELGAAGRDRRGQTWIAAWREAGMIAGTLLALVLPALSAGDALAASATGLVWLLPLAVAAAFMLPAHVLPAAHPQADWGLRAMWRATSRAARELIGIHLLNALAAGTAATLFVIYARDVIGLDDRGGGLLLLAYFVAALAALPAWVVVARRIGNVRTWQVAMLVAAAAFVPAALLGEGQVVAFAAVCVFTGATLGADIALPAAVQGHIVGHESRAHARPRGGALFGLWGMASKLALALAAGITLPLLALLTAPPMGWQRAAVVPWLYAGLPVVIKLAAVLLLQRSSLHGMNLSEPEGKSEVSDETPTIVDTARGSAGNGGV